jgi:hypothetical protein
VSGSRDEVEALIADQDAAFRALTDLGSEPAAAPEGPVQLGDSKTLSSGSAISKLAAFYLDAFRTGKVTLPYFTTREQ